MKLEILGDEFHALPRSFDVERQVKTLVWLECDVEDVRVDLAYAVDFEERNRRLLVTHSDLSESLWQPLARPHHKWHAAPAPVVHVDADRGVSLGLGGGRYAGFVEIPVHRLAVDDPALVPAPHNGFGRDGIDRTEDLHLLVAYGVGFETNGRFHRNQRQNLKKVVLDDVADDARVVEILGATFHTESLCHGDVNRVDLGAVPP